MVFCSNCYKPGHISRACSNPKSNKVCDNCNKPGKLVRGTVCRSCYDRSRRGALGHPTLNSCSFCFKSGHNIRRCPERKAEASHELSDRELSADLQRWVNNTSVLPPERRKLLLEVVERLRR